MHCAGSVRSRDSLVILKPGVAVCAIEGFLRFSFYSLMADALPLFVFRLERFRVCLVRYYLYFSFLL